MAGEIRPQGRREILELLDRHGCRPRKALGQHFLADPNIVERIVRLAGVDAESRVVEIGAGTGTLTRALAATGAHVVAYEVDQDLRPVLEESVAGAGLVDLRFEDVTVVDFTDALGSGPWTLVANLPYNVGTPLVLDLLRKAPDISRFVVMVQREVADRLAAEPGSRRYGVPSVIARLHASVRFGFTVPPQVFVPSPDVESAVVSLERIVAPAFAGQAAVLAQAAFGQRRKMLRRSLATALTDPETILESVGIDPTKRAEDLTVEEYLAIAGAVSSGLE
jgi:16S rRNA (adenine1518-N6/adenine1519-N6)-dimethyltransferase